MGRISPMHEYDHIEYLEEELSKAKQQRAELLEALKAAQGYIRFGQDLLSADEVVAKAIAKAEAAE